MGAPEIAPKVAPEIALEVRGLRAGYGRRAVVFDVDLDVHAGEVVALLGSNGAGKTTVLDALVGLLHPMAGTITIGPTPWPASHPHRGVASGLGLVPAEQFTFPGLTVAESLALGARSLPAGEREAETRRVVALFPKLGSRLRQDAATMSGGEQRMLSIATALLGRPRVLLLDEPSLGLAPAVAADLTGNLRGLADETGLAVLMVEQNVHQALSIADRAYVLRSGRIIHESAGAVVREQTDWWSLF